MHSSLKAQDVPRVKWHYGLTLLHGAGSHLAMRPNALPLVNCGGC